MSKKKASFEEAVIKIEEIVDLLENEEVSLEKSIAYYKEAMTLSAFCQEKLMAAEGEVLLLQKELTGSFNEKPFDIKEEL